MTTGGLEKPRGEEEDANEVRGESGEGYFRYHGETTGAESHLTTLTPSLEARLVDSSGDENNKLLLRSRASYHASGCLSKHARAVVPTG